MKNFIVAILFCMTIVFSALAWQTKSDFDLSLKDKDGDGIPELIEKNSLNFLGSLLIAGFTALAAILLMKNKIEINV